MSKEGEKDKEKKRELIRNFVIAIAGNIRDPEIGISLLNAGLLKEEFVEVDIDKKIIEVKWIPSTPFCPLIMHISAVIRARLKEKFQDWDIRVRLHPDVIGSDSWNERLKNNEELDKLVEEIKQRGWWDYFIIKE
ncbi:MAG: iron-sulfur cluster assembly protein [Candidatus Njordarchaeales archaeon]